MVRKFDDTIELLSFVENNETNPTKQTPMKFFRYSLAHYVVGFLESAVFCSSLSVELMLFRSAIRKFGKDKLVKMKAEEECATIIHLAHRQGRNFDRQ